MKRRILVFLCAAVFMSVGASPAWGDRGTGPGTTFPEQPAGHVANACAAVNSNPGTGVGGVVEQNISPTAGAIVSGLLGDACS
jgi:hypothetical protein